MSPREIGLWAVRDYLPGYSRLQDNHPNSDIAIRVTNDSEVYEVQRQALHAWARDHGGLWPAGDVRLPLNIPRPKLMLPIVEYAPDFINASSYYMVSGRLRCAMALPDATCQFLPVELIDGSDLAYERDYKWLAYLASEDVLDLERSEYDFCKPWPEQSEDTRSFHEIRRFVVREDFEPRSGLFEMARFPGVIMATETLARRVERAGCTGMSFADLESRVRSGIAPRYREPSGV